MLSFDTLPSSNSVASTLEPASTVNPSGFFVLENLILTSCSAPLPPLPPVLVTVIVPGTGSVVSYLPV